MIPPIDDLDSGMTEDGGREFAGFYRCGRARCYTSLMVHVFRYAGIALAILVFAVVLLACGEGACSACLDACCSRMDPTKRPGALLGRIAGALRRSLTTAVADVDARLEAGARRQSIAVSPNLAMEVSTLRI